MLKVMKYDWRNGWNTVKSTLLIAAILSVVIGVFMGILGGRVELSSTAFGIFGEGTPDKLFMFLSITWLAVMFALLVQTLDSICRNMIGRMFGAEGYFTHTLPVKTWELLLGKAVGTWLFGVFMVFVALTAVFLMMFSTVIGTGELGEIITKLVTYLPKLGAYHFQSLAHGAGYVLYGVAAFLVWSFLIVVQFQFICIAARQFGRFHVAGGFIVFWLLCCVEGNLNHALSMGFVIFLLSSAACFFGGCWLLKHRLSF